MLNSNEPIKVAHLQKLANQRTNQSCSPSKISQSVSVEVLNGAFVIEKWLILLVKARKTFVV